MKNSSMLIKNREKQKIILKLKKICESAYLKGNVTSLLKIWFLIILNLMKEKEKERLKIIWKSAAIKNIWKTEIWKLFENWNFENYLTIKVMKIKSRNWSFENWNLLVSTLQLIILRYLQIVFFQYL